MTPLNRIRNAFPVQIAQVSSLALVLLAFWGLAMIALPIARWTLGEEAIPLGINIAAALQASAVFAMTAHVWGVRRTALTFAAVALITWGAEYIGSHTGFPFGVYEYTTRLQPQVGEVPLLIPVAWFMMLPPSWAIAQTILGRVDSWQRRIAFIGLSALALTAWDLFLDPQMVAWGFWVWDNPVGYFGIPWSNYAGWLLVAVIVTAAVHPPRLNNPLLLVVYGIVWFLQSVGQAFFWQQPGPALVGSLAMGSLMLWAWLAHRRRQADA